ncbi:filamin-A-like isoform X5 [Anneissia japonica]|uniref:filamin-A-like isoform X5 n=1 Tax=Anneissia japonica TaxID=1529436 RepID=UPI0014259EDD|nr:filamin-A-like isoform X5 [Anneissia japonica]
MSSNGEAYEDCYYQDEIVEQKRELDEDEEMPLAEKDLADDAPWKKIQQNTFTRWCNEHLKVANKHIGGLETDLCDGLRLISLVEVLSQKRVGRFNKRPTFRSMKLENVSVVMSFLESKENIKIVNIDSSDIVDGRLKLILGLIWTLILHYSISMPMWDEEGEGAVDGQKKKKETPKEKLLGWIQSKVPDLPIKNFNKDWNDGRAVGALVDSCAPGLCPDWEDWDPANKLDNAREAMQLADDWLNVPQLLAPEDMVNPRVDDLSMMTYLSEFPKAKLKPGAPLRPRSNSKKVRAYGPGIEKEGNAITRPTHFTVETYAAGSGTVTVTIINPNGEIEPHEIKYNKDKNKSYTVEYTPRSVGTYTVKVAFNNTAIPKSPFTVVVGKLLTDPSKCSAEGPGLQPTGVMLDQSTYFEVFTAGAGLGELSVTVKDPNGDPTTSSVMLEDKGKGVFYCQYTPTMMGTYTIEITFSGANIPGSVFEVKVVPEFNPKNAFAYGRGIQNKGLRAKEKCVFYVDTKKAGEANLKVQIIGPGGIDEPVKVVDNGDGTFTCSYSPFKPGRYIVHIIYGKEHIPKSPFTVNISPEAQGPITNVRAFGPGLEKGVAGKPCTFTVETNGAVGALGFAIEGPSEAEIKCADNGDGSCEVTYYPTVPGEYAIHITFDEEDIEHSPYMAKITPDPLGFDAGKVVASGPGLKPDGLLINEKTEFTVDARAPGCGKAELEIFIFDQLGNKIQPDIRDNKNGTWTVSYTPTAPLKHSVAVTWGKVSVPKSPFRVTIGAGPGAVKLYGPGLESGNVKSKEPTEFTVDCTEAGKGPIQVKCTSAPGVNSNSETPIKCDVTDNKDGTYTARYTPQKPGNYVVEVKFKGKDVPQSPITVQVVPTVDVSKITIDGLQEQVFVGCPTDFTVNAKAVGPQANQLKDLIDCTLQSPSGTKVKPVITDNKDGTYRAEYTPVEEGPHKLDVNVAGKPVGKSPYKVGSKKGCDPKKVKAFGPGLESGLTDAPAVFTIETKGAGQGGLGIAIEGPCEAEMKCVDNNDGSCTVEYMPTKPGEYDVHVTFADTPIPGSPFKPVIRDVVDPSKVLVSGPGVNPVGVRANVPAPFQVDATKAGKAPLECTILPERAPKEHAQVYDNEDGTFDCSYVPKNEGRKCAVEVKYDGKHVPGSPFNTRVLPQFDASKVKVSGPGVQPSGVLASLPVEFLIDTKEAGEAQLAVSIIDATGKPVKPTIVDNGDGTYTVSYTPKDIGPYTILITFGGNKVPGAPFSVSVSPTGDASKCQIVGVQSGPYEIPVRRQSVSSESTTTTRTTTTRTTTTRETITKTVVVEEETVIKINSQDAGQGMVTCAIMGPDGVEIEDVQVIDNGDGTFDIVWTCPVSGRYNLDMKFGGMPITGGPISIGAGEGPPEEEIIPFEVQGVESAAMPQECRPFDLVLPLGGIGQGRVHGEVTTPTGKKHKPQITENKDGTITVKYAPTETGLHHLNVMYNNQCIPGSPFQFHVDEIKSGQATAYGPGLTHGICEQPCHFIINTKDAGPGGVALAVEGPSKAEIKCKDNKDGTCDVTYYPLKPGDYALTVKFADKHVPGSPFTAKIVDKTGAPMCVGACSDIPLKINETDLSLLTASIKMPSGCEENCQLKRLPNQNIGITFTPREVGEHAVSVKKFGRHITNSPFKIIVGSQEVGDASKVKVSGLGIAEGDAGEIAEFKVDTSKAGFGGLGVSIEGPSKTEINCEDNGDGTCIVTYKPQEPGNYILNVKYADQHVPGSPFKVKVHGKDGEMVTETLVRPRLASPVSHIGNKCDLGLKVPGSDPLDMTAHVTNPEGKTDDAEIIDGSDCRYTVRFVPEMMGVHTISVKHKGMHIPGSPFQFTVGPFGEGGAHKVHAGGLGLERGEVNTPAEFTVWTREAGPGSLGIAVEGPAKAEINFTDNKDGSCQVAYVPTEQGEYVIKITYNDEPIPDSPFRPFIQPSLGEARRVSVTSLQETGLKANQPASFAIQLNGAKGEITAKVVSPTGTEEECLITEIDRDNFAVRFLPHENGIHMIHVNFREQPIAGSPFRVRVGTQAEVGDPGMVHASGDGLEKGKTGQPCEFVVNTCGAGTGVLSISVDGPSKVKMDVTEVPEGYKCSYVPTAPGDYLISIKFAGAHHIVGSPYKARITGPAKTPVLRTHETSNVIIETVTKTQTSQMLSSLPHFHSNASKVTSTGMGLKKAFRNKRSQFTVNAADAGHNMLMVGIAGPKTPCEEILVKHNGRNRFIVNYTLKDIGEYMLVVKWGDEHIPGSPFHIKCSV